MIVCGCVCVCVCLYVCVRGLFVICVSRTKERRINSPNKMIPLNVKHNQKQSAKTDQKI